MTRLPVYQRRVQPSSSGVPTRIGALPDANTEAIARGVGSVGSGVDEAFAAQQRADAKYQRELDEAKHKADVTAARNALTAWQDHETSVMDGQSAQLPAGGAASVYANTGPAAPPSDAAIAAAGGERTVVVPVPEQGAFNESLKVPTVEQGTPGFLSTRGQEAAAASAEAYDSLKKKQADLAGELVNDNQRALFLEQSDQLLVTSRRRIEGHVAQQVDVAHEDSVNAAKASALNTIANNYTDPHLVQQQVAGVIGPMSALYKGRGDKAQLEENSFLADVAKVRINQYLADKDWKGAQAVFAQTKDQLGVQATHFENVIRLQRDKSEADRLAIDVVDASRLPTGFVEPATAIARFQALPEAQRTEEATQAFGKWMQLEAAKKSAAVNGVYDSALGQYLGRHQLGDVSANSEAWLRAVDPESWRKLEQMQRADAAHARGEPATPSQERALAQFRIWAADNPDLAAQMSAADFNRTWAPLLAHTDRDNAVGVLAGYHAYANKPEKMANAVDAAVLDAGGKGGAGVLPTDKRSRADWSPDELDVYARAAAYVQKQANEFRRSSGGKDPSPDDLRGWAKELFLSGKDPKGGFLGLGGGTTRIEAEMKGTDFTPSFGADEKAKASEVLRQAGARVDDSAVDAYLRVQHGLLKPDDLKRILQAAPPAPKPDPTIIVPGQWGLDTRTDEEIQAEKQAALDEQGNRPDIRGKL